jgi:hypothetical protein
MSTQKRSVLKNWFRKGLTPTQAQFADAFDSFFHKTEDFIPLNNVQGLAAAIESKKYELQQYLNSRLNSAVEDLDGRINNHSESTVSSISFGGDNNGLWIELTMLSGGTVQLPLSIPLATTGHNGLMSSSDKETLGDIAEFLAGSMGEESLKDQLDNQKDRIEGVEDKFIDIAEYMHEDDELPANGVYLYEGYPVDSRLYSMSDGDTYWLAFCLKKGDTSDDGFGIGVKDCILYQAESRTDMFICVGHYYGNEVPSHVQKAFGYVLASSDNAGLMSASDKEALDYLRTHQEKEVIMIDLWDEEEPGIMKDTINEAGIYYYKYNTKELYVSNDVPVFVSVPLSGDVIYVRKDKNIPYIWKDGDMKPIAPEDIPASIFNATNEIPVRGYYVLCDAQNEELSAVHAAWNAGKAVSGLIISFEIAAGLWKTYQYIGKTVTSANWLNTDNWKDFGSLAAGSETYIIINDLIGAPIAGEYYTLETAVARLVAYQNESGVTYAKKGLIISYRTGENEMETKQFQGEVTDFGEVGLWKDFGGGSDVETADEPEEDGEDAFSTGGAYAHIPTGIKVDTETEGVVKLQLENAGGDGIGDEVQFPVGTGGGGGGSGTIVTAAFQQSPMYGNAGGSFIIRAAVRSVTTVGSSEQENTIATIALYDRDTNTLLETFLFNKASSVSLSTYDFVMDVSQYFAAAGVRRFRCLITDDGGNTGSRNINVTAVDVTVSSVQTLQYTQSTALTVGGGAKSIPLYKFANNASDRGITAITEIYLNGSWQQLGSSVISDTYSHGITIDPTNCLGSVLSHGAYPIRVHGVDVASGVVGNYLYSGIFVIDESSTTPLVVESWTCETANAAVKLYETITVNYAVYDPTNNAPTATVYLDGNAVQSHTAYRSTSYTYTHQVTGVVSDGTFSHIVKAGVGAAYGTEAEFLVSGTVIDAALKSGAIYAFDFSNRSNEESDHTITSGGKTIAVSGSNWSTTGFRTFLGEKCLRIAEDVTAVLNHQPFKPTSIEANGLAIQFAFASKNLVDDNAVLMQCYHEGVGAGFYVTGKAVGIYCSTGLSNHVEERAYRQGEKVTVAVVVEPAAEGLGQTRSGTTYYFIKLYLNGE